MALSGDEDVAIVGVGCRFPGADDLQEFWRVLAAGEDHVVEVPSDRWNLDAFYDPDGDTRGKTYVRRAGFVHGHDEFDNRAFGISDLEAASMDPQQRFALECTFMALENAGISRQQITGSNTGVYLGVMNNDYKSMYGLQSPTNNYTLTGASTSNVAARVSYVFDLRGNSLVVNTACSSSLEAVHLACQALRAGDVEMAIAGGVNCLMDPGVFIQLSRARMASPSGKSQAFSAHADGYARGEGCGILILKLLKDARLAGDRVWATMYTGANQDGHAVTPMTAPSWRQQKVLFTDVIKRTKVELDRIEYIEAHGTGTKAGDPVEIRSLGEFFLENGSPCRRVVGSVKTNIGHLESAAGVAGLIKVLLMMRHGKFVPSLHFTEPNPRIDFQRYNMVVPTELAPWPTPEKFALVNSFSFGGTNSHAVLASSPQMQQLSEAPDGDGAANVVCLSAMGKDSLERAVEDLCQHASAASFRMKDLSFTSCLRRDVYPYRLAVVATSPEELVNNLRNAMEQPREAIKPGTSPRIVYVFCGMGTGWAGMGREMIGSYPVFREVIESVDRLLLRFVHWSLLEKMMKGEDATDPIYGPIAIFACQVALARLWRDWGVKPDCIVGQSVGEVAAACAAGILSLDDAVTVIYHRTSVLAEARGGKMLVVGNMPVEQVEELCRRYPGRANVSLYYNPFACSVSGDADVVDEMRAILEAMPDKGEDFFLRDLNVTSAYHSHHMDKCKAQLLTRLGDLQPSQNSKEDIVSSVTAERPMNGEFCCSEYWARNVREPSYFYQALMKCFEKGVLNVCLEIGPKAVLRVHMRHLAGTESIALPSMLENLERRCILQTACKLFENGVKPDWSKINLLEGANVIDLPRYRFSRVKNLYIPPEMREKLAGTPIRPGDHRLLRRESMDAMTHFKAFIREDNFESVFEHRFQGSLLLPGAFHVELGLAYISQTGIFSVYDTCVSAKFKEPIRLQKSQGVELDIQVTTEQFENGQMRRIFNVLHAGKIHATGSLRKVEPLGKNLRWDIEAIRRRCPTPFTRKEKYDVLERMGFSYGETLRVSGDSVHNSSECLMELKLNDGLKKEMLGTVLHPAILDGVFQAAIPMIQQGEPRPFLPVAVGGVTLRRPLHEGKLAYSFFRRRTPALEFYTINVVTDTGEVVLEIDDFAIQFIGVETIDRVAYIPGWRPLEVNPNKQQPEDQDSFWSSAVVLSDVMPASCPAISLQPNRVCEQSFEEEMKREISKGKSAVVLYTQGTLKENADADSVHQEALILCQAVRHVLFSLVHLEKTIPVILVTRGAWKIPGTGRPSSQTTLSGATLWGLVRSIVREKFYLNVRLVDHHLDQTADVGSLLPSIIATINLENLKDMPELIICKDRIYCNEISRADMLDTMGYSALATDFACKANMYCTQSLRSGDVFFKFDDGKNKRVNENNVIELRAACAALLDTSALSRSRGEELLHREGRPVYYIEMVGRESAEAEQLICCLPAPAATWIRVPKQCTLPLADFPQYKPGMLSRVFLLFRLCQYVTSSSVAVLSDEASLPYAELLTEMLVTRGIQKVKTILVDSIPLLTSVDLRAVISLVNISTSTAVSLANAWVNPQTFCSLEQLASTGAVTQLASCLPHVNIHLLTLSGILLLSPLLGEANSVMRWVRQHKHAVERAAKAWSSVADGKATDTENNVADIMTAVLKSLSQDEIAKIPVRAEEGELLRQDASYIVVGGLTGLGWEITNFLAAAGAGHVVLMGRRPPAPSRQEELRRLEREHGCKTLCVQADVSQMDALEAAMETISRNFSGVPLKGIFFGAGVLNDCLYETMTMEKFHSVTKPKIMGAWNFHLLTKELPLDFFVLHSSVTSVFGNPGQTNYGAANAFMDALAAHRRSLGLSAVAINWGPLAMGMTQGQDAVARNLMAQGYHYLQGDEVIKCLELALRRRDAQILFSKIDRDVFTSRMLREDCRPLLIRMAPILAKNAPVKETSKASTALHFDVGAMLKLDPERRRAALISYILSVASRVFGVDEATLTTQTSMFELGVDSMLAMAMINQIYQDTGCRLTVVLLLGQDSLVKDVATSLERTLLSKNGDVSENSEAKVTSTAYYTMRHLQKEVCFGFCLEIKNIKDSKRMLGLVRETALAVICRHPVLRTCFAMETLGEDGQGRVKRTVLDPEEALDFRVVQRPGTPAGAEETALHKAEAMSPNKGPVRLIVAGVTPSLTLSFVLNCIAFDLESTFYYIEAFRGTLMALAKGTEPPEMPFDGVIMNDEIDAAIEAQAGVLETFWRDLTSTTVSKVSVADKQPQMEGESDRRVVSGEPLSPAMASSVRAFCSEHHITTYKLFACCYQLLLAFVSAQRTAPLCMYVSARHRIPSLRRALGNSTNIVPWVAHVDPARTFQEYMKATAKQMDLVLDHCLYPTVLIQRLAGEGAAALFRHGVVTENMTALNNLRSRSEGSNNPFSLSHITHTGAIGETMLRIWENDQAITFEVNYNAALLSEGRARSLLEALPLLLEAATSSPNESLGELSRHAFVAQLRAPGSS